jgi:threonine aldolase
MRHSTLLSRGLQKKTNIVGHDQAHLITWTAEALNAFQQIKQEIL